MIEQQRVAEARVSVGDTVWFAAIGHRGALIGNLERFAFGRRRLTRYAEQWRLIGTLNRRFPENWPNTRFSNRRRRRLIAVKHSQVEVPFD